MKLLSRILAVSVLATMVISAYAQGGGGQRRGGRNNTSIAGLVNRADVQADIQLTDDEKTKLQALRDQMRQQGGGGGGGGGTPPTPEERMQRQQAMDKQVEAILTADQVKRVHEIQIQLMGIEAATLPGVQDTLGLSDDQKSKIKALAQKRDDANRSAFQNSNGDRQAARQAMQTNKKAFDDGLGEILTADQQSKIKELGGKTFTPADNGGGGRG